MFNNQRANIIDALLETPAAKAIAAAEEKKIVETRGKLAQDRERLEKEAAAAFEAHYLALGKAIERQAKARDALRAAGGEIDRLNASRAGEVYRERVKMAEIEQALRETAHPSIRIFTNTMLAELEKALRAAPVDSTTTITNINTGAKTQVGGRPLVRPSHLAAKIREIIANAEGLTLAADQSGVLARLADLRASLPTIGEELASEV